MTEREKAATPRLIGEKVYDIKTEKLSIEDNKHDRERVRESGCC
jgi:hypothetical protein